MAKPEVALVVWGEMRVWFPAQSDRLQGDTDLRGGMLRFLRSIDPGTLLRAWARIKARPRVYASDSLPALVTQALGDEAADQVASPNDFEAWVKREMRQGTSRRIDAPTPLHQEAIDACGGWYDLGQSSTKDLEWRLRPGRAVFDKARDDARLEAATKPGSVSLPAPAGQRLVGRE